MARDDLVAEVRRFNLIAQEPQDIRHRRTARIVARPHLLIKTKPAPQAMKDYQASSAGQRFIEAIAYVRAYPIDLPSLRAALPGIRTPVLSIWGAHDPLVPPANADVLDRGLPRTRSMQIDSGHFVWEDQAENYAAAIRGGYRAV
jgi:pimeloyl-ACP methyl ester carboxylesterase